MWRVDADLVFRAPAQADIGAGLGAMPVHDVGLEFPDQADDLQPDREIGKARFAADRDPLDAELQPRFDFFERSVRAFAAGDAVGDDADMMSARDLAVGDVEDMAEDAADRGAHHMQN